MTPSAALNACFGSASPLWAAFLARFGKTPQRVAWYPSAGVDLRPMLNWKRESFGLMNLDLTPLGYEEPNLFIFSDYFFHDPEKNFWDFYAKGLAKLLGQSQTSDDSPGRPSSRRIRLHADGRTMIRACQFCEIAPNPAYYRYELLQQYLRFKPSKSTGRAFYFRASVQSDRLGNYELDAIYFAYNNVNLLQQFFLRHEVPLSHLCWNCDGSGKGGGRLRHGFLVPISVLLLTQWYFISKCYLQPSCQSYESEDWPAELRETRQLCPASVLLNRVAAFQWSQDDRVAFLTRALS